MTDVYTIDEVARHNNAKDLWVVIDGVIYNLTLFYKEHPGGEEVLLELAGQDATECFNNVGHSNEALNLRECLKIGVLVDGSDNPDSSDPSSKSKITEESTGLMILFSFLPSIVFLPRLNIASLEFIACEFNDSRYKPSISSLCSQCFSLSDVDSRIYTFHTCFL